MSGAADASAATFAAVFTPAFTSVSPAPVSRSNLAFIVGFALLISLLACWLSRRIGRK